MGNSFDLVSNVFLERINTLASVSMDQWFLSEGSQDISRGSRALTRSTISKVF